MEKTENKVNWEDNWISKKELQDFLGLGNTKMSQFSNDYNINTVKVGRKIFYSVADVQKLFNNQIEGQKLENKPVSKNEKLSVKKDVEFVSNENKPITIRKQIVEALLDLGKHEFLTIEEIAELACCTDEELIERLINLSYANIGQ